MKSLAPLLTVTAIALAPATAAAESAQERAAAREHTRQAQVHYNLGRFDEALDEYSTAYELFPHPAFLFNIGQCHRELGNHDRALFFFEGYLREMPEAPNRQLVLELIADCQQALEQRGPPDEEPPDAGVGDASVGETGEGDVADAGPAGEGDADLDAEAATTTEVEAGEVALELPPPEEPPQPASRPIYRRWWFWTILGVLVAGGVAGGVVAGVSANNPTVVPPSGSAGTVDWR